MLCIAGVVFTVACARASWPGDRAPRRPRRETLRGFDVVFGYQTSWLLMFGDYSRYSTIWTRRQAMAVFAGLGLTALWFIPLGLVASTIARSSDPGAMVQALGLGWWGGDSRRARHADDELREHLHVGARAEESAAGDTGPDRASGSSAASAPPSACCRRRGSTRLANFTLLLAGCSSRSVVCCSRTSSSARTSNLLRRCTPMRRVDRRARACGQLRACRPGLPEPSRSTCRSRSEASCPVLPCRSLSTC